MGRTRGFTLIELMVTVVMVAILATVAVPSFQQIRIGNQLASDVNSVLAGLHYARSEAVKRRASVELHIVTDGIAWTYEVRREGSEDPLQVRGASGNRVALSASESPVEFNHLGRAAGSCADGCRLELSVADECRAIRVNQLGNIRREECAEES